MRFSVFVASQRRAFDPSFGPHRQNDVLLWSAAALLALIVAASSARADDGGWWPWGSSGTGTGSMGWQLQGDGSRIAANAGRDQHVSVGATVEVDGSASLSPNGAPLSYSWVITSKPSASRATLTSATAIRPQLVIDTAGDYVLTLTVRASAGSHSDDDGGTISTSQVTLSTVNVRPVASAGRNRIAPIGSTLALDGAGSFDADGNAITYSWSLVQVPRGSHAALTSRTALRPLITLDQPGTYVAELTVTDQTGAVSLPSRIAISTRAAVAGIPSAGPAQSLPVKATARIDAGGTYSPGGPPQNAIWSLIAAPTGSKSVLAIAPDAREALTPDVAGDYVVQMSVGGGGACGPEDDFDDHHYGSQRLSRLATVLISTNPVAPVARTGSDQRVSAGAPVTLDAVRSTDVTGPLLTYNWALIGKPTGSTATLSDPNAVRPTFTADIAGAYVAQLIVSDGVRQSMPVTVVIAADTVTPLAHLVDAGTDPLGVTGTTVPLDGRASTDPDGATLQAQWSILGLGDQLTGLLTTPNALQTGFVIPTAGVALNLAVLRGPATLAIWSGGDDNGGGDGYGGDDGNSLSLTSVGRLTGGTTPYSIWRVRNASSTGKTATLASADLSFTLGISIAAKSDLFVASTVVADRAQHKLSAAGKLVSTANATTSAFTDARLVGGGPALRLSVVELIATNALLASFGDVVVSTVEARPLAVPHAVSSAYRGVAVALDGLASKNPNMPATPTSGLTYRWSLLARPAGSTAALTNPTMVQASLTPDVYGLYVAQLIVSDGTLDSRPQTVAIMVTARPPVASVAALGPVPVGQLATLDGSASLDPDGNALTYAWMLTGVPTGSVATLANAGAPKAGFTPDVAGTYSAQLIVRDAYGASSPASATLVAQSLGLQFDTLAPQSVALGSSTAFTVHATDPNGKPVRYMLTSVLPAGATFNAASGAVTFRPASNVPAAITLTFAATDGTDTATLTVPITITGGTSGATAAVSAQVLDAVDFAAGRITPVAGAVVSSNGINATSSSTGAVTLSGLPAGTDTLTVSAAGTALAPDGTQYGDAVTGATLIAGVTNTLPAPILLPRGGISGVIVPGGVTTVTNPTLGITLTIAPNAATNPDGTPYTGRVTLGALPPTTPMSLPPGFAPCTIFTVSPAGIAFNPPAQMSVANADNLPPGSIVDLWAFDPVLGSARVTGTGTVSADGATVGLTTGGVAGGTILAFMPRRPGGAVSTLQPADTFVPSLLGDGNLQASFAPPVSRILDQGRGRTFLYNSATARPTPVLRETARLGANTGLPATLATTLAVDGVTQAASLVTNLGTPQPGGAALNGTVANALVQAGVADASQLSTGAHNYSFLTIAKFGCSAVATQAFGSIVVNNQSKSPFGPGWQLAELQALTPNPDGSIAVTDGTGITAVARPQQAPSFIPNPVYVPVNGPFRGTMADLQGKGRPDLMRLGWKDGSLNVILNQGNRQFAKVPAIPVGTIGTLNPDQSLSVDAADLAVGDLSGDGTPDILLSYANEPTSKIFFGAGGGTFAPYAASIGQNEVGGYNTLGDWIGSGRLQGMVSEGHGVGAADFHPVYNDGFGHFAFNYGSPNIPGDASGMTTARFPGMAHDSFVGVTQDGSILFAYGGANAATNKIWTYGVGAEPGNIGTANRISPIDLIYDGTQTDTLKLPGAVNPSDRGRIVSTGDIDGSGTPAFAVAGTGGIYIVRWSAPGAGNQRVTQTLTLPGGLVPDAVTLAPLARGNRASVIATAGTAGFYVFLNDGTGNFAAPVLIQTPFRVGIEITVADFDGDGLADVALNDLDNDRVAIYFGKANSTGAFVAPIGDYTRLVQNPDGTYSRLYNDGTRVDFTSAGLQTTLTDANGNKSSYAYNGAGQLASIVDPTGTTTSFTYAGAYIASMTDAAGRTTSFTHDANGNTTSISDPLGNVTQYLYDAAQRLIATIDPKGAKSTNAYTATGQLKSQTYPDGTSVTLDVSKALGLDALGPGVSLGGPANAAFVPEGQRLSLIQDAKGNQTETEVNAWGAVIRSVDPLGRTSLFARDAANRVIESVTPAGVSTGPIAPTAIGTPQVGASDSLVNDYTWDANGNLLRLEEGVGHAPHRYTGSTINRVTAWTYEPAHNRVASKTDPAGFTTRYAFDANGNQLSMTDALGNVTAYTYDARGLRLTTTDARGNSTTNIYDANGNRTRSTDATGTNFDLYYDTAGNQILSIDATGTPIERRRSMRYDSLDRKVGETSATGEITTYAFDANSNLSAITDPANNVTSRAYDTRNRPISEVRPGRGALSWTYDANGRLVTRTDASGAVWSNTYDGADRRVSQTGASGAVQTLAYDLRDNVASFTDSNGQTTTFEYDALKRLNFRFVPGGSTQPGGGGSFAMQYDARDHEIWTATPDHQATILTYDALSRLLSDGKRTRTYDAAGNVLTVAGEWASTITYTYDPLNRIASTAFYGPGSGDYGTAATLSYSYDALSRRTSMADTLGGTTGYTFDAEDRVASITAPWGAKITQTYDTAGRPLRLAYPNGLDADVTFEAGTGRVATIAHRAGTGAAPIASFAHTYDVRGNLASLTELTATKTYINDALERLTAVASQTGAAAPAPSEAYSYDGEGNRTTAQTGTAAPLAVTVDAQNRVTDDGVNTYTWTPSNALGARTPKASGASATTFNSSWHGAYNQMRLDGASTPDGNVQLYYDPENRLVGYRGPVTGGNYDDRYYDGDDMVLQFRRLAGGVTQWARYVMGPGIDRPLGLELYPAGAAPTPGTGQVFYYHADGEGSIRLLSDANGQVANRYDYDSFGKPLTVVEAVSQPYTWKGREYIAAVGQYYNRARFYDPQLGRFTSEDPLGYKGSRGGNLTAFGLSNPHKYNDPSGRTAADNAATFVIAANAGALGLNVGQQVACVLGTVAAAFALINQGDKITLIDTHSNSCSVNGIRVTTTYSNITKYLDAREAIAALKNVGVLLLTPLVELELIVIISDTAGFTRDSFYKKVTDEEIVYIPDFSNPTQIIELRN